MPLFHGYALLWRVPFALMLLLPTLLQAVPLKLENELLLDLRLEGERLGLDILGYQRDRAFYVSLEEFVHGVGFAIEVNAGKGMASGWYIEPGREFRLDLEAGEVVSGDRRFALEPDEVVAFQGGLYADARAVERWFPLSISVLLRELTLNIKPDEVLPIQQRMARRSRDDVRPSGGDSQRAQLPLQETPYRALGPHTTRMQLGYSTTRQNPDSDAYYRGSYALMSRGDLGWMSSSLSLAGNSDDRLSGARLRLERADLNGPLALKHIEIGDVSTASSRGMLLRGGSVRGGLDSRFADETITLEGSQLPNWDVELYQNGQLVATQVTGENGRYLFEDIPLLFGENRFEFQFYGPFGETETREVVHYLGPDMLAPGRVSYQLVALQAGRTVFDLEPTTSVADRDSGQYRGSVNVGITRSLTTGLGVESMVKEGERLEYYNAGLGLATSMFYLSSRYYYRPDEQDSLGSSLRTRLGGTQLNLGYTRYYDSDSDGASARNWDGQLGVRASVYGLPLNLDAALFDREGSSSLRADLGTTLSTGRGRFSTALSYQRNETDDGTQTVTTDSLSGTTNVSTTVKPWRFRLGASYLIEPQREMLSYGAHGSLRMDESMTLNLDVTQNLASDITYYRGGINWLFDWGMISPRVSYDSDERWAGFITVSTTLVPQPRTAVPRFDRRSSVNSGVVEARVAMADEQGEPLPGVRVDAVQAWRHDTTDERGVAYIPRLPAQRQVDVQLDPSTIPEPDLRSSQTGVSVIPRPGSYAVVDFPMLRTAELEGHVTSRAKGESQPVSRVLVLLQSLDGETVARRRTAFDGFFLFTGVEPGNYRLVLEGPYRRRVVARPEEVRVTADGGVIRELDFSLRPEQDKSLVQQAREQASGRRPATSPGTGFAPTNATSRQSLAGASRAESNTATATATGAWFVQLGAFGSRASAEQIWQQLSSRYSELQGKIPRYQPYRGMTRLLVAPGQRRGAAQALCRSLQAAGQACFIQKVEQ